MFDEGRHNGYVSVELYLTGHVDDDEIFFRQRVNRLSEEVEIIEKEPTATFSARSLRMLRHHHTQSNI